MTSITFLRIDLATIVTYFFSSPPRNLKPELLDLDEAPFDEVQDSLEDVRLVNRYLGGYKILLYYPVSYTHLTLPTKRIV